MPEKSPVVQLGLAKEEPDEAVIQCLKHWLKTAEDGVLQGVIILGVSNVKGYRRSSAGRMGDAEAVYLATLVIHDGVEDSKNRETQYDPDPENV